MRNGGGGFYCMCDSGSSYHFEFRNIENNSSLWPPLGLVIVFATGTLTATEWSPVTHAIRYLFTGICLACR